MHKMKITIVDKMPVIIPITHLTSPCEASKVRYAIKKRCHKNELLSACSLSFHCLTSRLQHMSKKLIFLLHFCFISNQITLISFVCQKPAFKMETAMEANSFPNNCFLNLLGIFKLSTITMSLA